MRMLRLGLWLLRAVLTLPSMLLVWIAAKLMRALLRVFRSAA